MRFTRHMKRVRERERDIRTYIQDKEKREANSPPKNMVVRHFGLVIFCHPPRCLSSGTPYLQQQVGGACEQASCQHAKQISRLASDVTP